MLGYVSVEPWDPTRRVFPLHKRSMAARVVAGLASRILLLMPPDQMRRNRMAMGARIVLICTLVGLGAFTRGARTPRRRCRRSSRRANTAKGTA